MKGLFHMDLYNEVMAHDRIYSLMYSPTRIDDKPLKDQIWDIDTSDLWWPDDRSVFYYIWHWAKPNDLIEYSNRYTEETYGKGWAFSRKEIHEAWEEKKL